MWTEGKVRIIDIAEELGVSTATVSNVIHGKTGKISDRTVKRVQERLDGLRRYTAVFAVSDYYAVELMGFLQNAGARVPEEVSVAGFDDSPLCEQVVPALTSVRQDWACRARMALELLGRMREDPDLSGSFRISVELIPRASTGRSRDQPVRLRDRPLDFSCLFFYDSGR